MHNESYLTCGNPLVKRCTELVEVFVGIIKSGSRYAAHQEGLQLLDHRNGKFSPNTFLLSNVITPLNAAIWWYSRMLT